MSRAIVVGSGPNGLAAAVRLADAGLDVTVLEASDRPGGGVRSSELTLPGLIHDDCSAFHPVVLASPYLRTLGLERHGLDMCWPEIEFGHPLDDGSVALAYRSIDDTAAHLGVDGARWRRVFGPIVDNFDALVDDLFGPPIHVPRHPIALARLSTRALLPATTLARAWLGEQAKALFGGVAAHQFARLNRPLSSSVGLVLTASAHAYGWPMAKGGSGSIITALAARLAEAGGRIETGVRVESAADLTDADVVVFDLMPPAVAALIGDRMPGRARRAYAGYRFGPAAFKLDLALDGPIPWRNPELAEAGTVHLGGTMAEIAAAEADICSGRMPDKPFVLVGQQAVADPTRSVGNIQPIWTYAHVPRGYTGDATAAILDQIERFAPGVRDRIVGSFTRQPDAMASYNTNYVGGDIAGGSTAGLRVILRPRVTLRPYDTGARGFYLCSAATPPGAGAHGMGGYHAAGAALRDLHR